MGIIAKSTGGDFELTPTGSYIARCFKMIDIGTQPSWNPDQRSQRKVIITWELLEDEDGEKVAMGDGRPFAVSETYTLSISPKANLRKAIDSWRGLAFSDEEAEAFDITKLLDSYCRIGIIHKPSKDGTRTYANVGSIGFTKKKPKAINEASWWSVEQPDMKVFETFPDFIKDKIKQSDEFRVAQAFPDASRQDESPMPENFLKDTVVEPTQEELDGAVDLKDLPY